MAALNSTHQEPVLNDLGPLAWVLDEVRTSLEASTKTLKRFVRDAAQARGTDLANIDSSQLRLAKQQLHQVVGALEMVDLEQPAQVLRGMEAAVQKFIQSPELCSDEAAGTLEKAGFALIAYLEGMLAGRKTSAVGLFSQYAEVQQLAGAARIHPADLWEHTWRWSAIAPVSSAVALDLDERVRSSMDVPLLSVMRSLDGAAAETLRIITANLSLSTQLSSQQASLWAMASAFFDAIAHKLLPADAFVKRTATGILLQASEQLKDSKAINVRLAQDLLFFCAHARKPGPLPASVAAVLAAYGLTGYEPVDYSKRLFGNYDPAMLAQARKRIAAVKETWSLVTAGESNKYQLVKDQIEAIAESIAKLFPNGADLAKSLTDVSDALVRQGRPPEPGVAMEVATGLLYSEAVLEDADLANPELEARTSRLAERIANAQQGGTAQPLEVWMEDLYRKVSDRQNMGSVVGELKVTLGELEKLMDQFFRNTEDLTPLQQVPGQLSQMRGVLSVLGLDDAIKSVQWMREHVELIAIQSLSIDEAQSSGVFEKIGINLGALGFLIDMLSYQPVLAKKLFTYDADLKELKPLMGRAANRLTMPEMEVEELSAAVNTTSQQIDVPADLDFAFDIAAPESLVEVAQVPAELSVTDQPLSVSSDSLFAATTKMSAFQAQQASENAAAPAAADDLSFDFPTTTIPTTEAESDAPVLSPQPETSDVVVSMDAAPTESTLTLEADSGATASVLVASNPLDDIDEELLAIFLEEANEVTGQGLGALDNLETDPTNTGELTTLRRSFHTLKGSSRMVGLNSFGEAAWSMEQVLNLWLADSKPANADMLALCRQAMQEFSNWISCLTNARNDGPYTPEPFQLSAQALTHEQRLLPLTFDTAAVEAEATTLTVEEHSAAPADVMAGFEEFTSPEGTDFADLALTAPALPDVDWGDLAPVVEAESVAEVAEVDAQASVCADSLDTAEKNLQAPVIELPEVEALAAESEDGAEPNDDDQYKSIGDLRINIPLYNMFLSEVDEWSRRLVAELSEWALENGREVPDSCVSLVHSIAGTSGTVGFMSLSTFARALEHCLLRDHNLGAEAEAHRFAETYCASAEEIRRMLHQFAAGILSEPQERLVAAVHAVLNEEPAVNSGMQRMHLDAEDLLTAEAIVEPVDAVAAEPEQAEPAMELDAAAELTASVAVFTPAFAPANAVVVHEPLSAELSHHHDDDIDAQDAIDEYLFPIFEDEAHELLPELSASLRQWQSNAADTEPRGAILRVLHTLKGSARLAGAMRLGEMAHRMESSIEMLGAEGVPAHEIDGLLIKFDDISFEFEALRERVKNQAETPSIPEPLVEAAPLEQEVPERSTDFGLSVDAALEQNERNADAATAGESLLPARQLYVLRASEAASQTVRVRSHLLDRLVNQAGEVMITRAKLENEIGIQLRSAVTDLTVNLERLRQHLRDIEVQSESQMQSRLALSKDTAQTFDPLEFDRFTRVQELTRMMAESVNDVATVQRNVQKIVDATEGALIAQARQTRELQRDLLRTRMVEFDSISERLYRVIRQAGKDTGKQVRLDIVGASIEIDRGVLERMTPAFEHLLRNCVAHGIESAAERQAAGKEVAGTITITVHQEGNDVAIEFKDDGAGLNVARILEKAREQGLIQEGAQLSDSEIFNLIYLPGFSTTSEVTAISGRGVGMDVVKSEVQSLGGRIETSSERAKGSNFKLVLPLTTAVTQVVMVRAGNLFFGVPANLLEIVRRFSQQELAQAYADGSVLYGAEKLDFQWAGALLQASPASIEPPGRTTPVVVFRSAAQRIAVHVDEVLGNQEVVVKNLGPQLSRLPGLAGMSVLASGAVVLIYNPVALHAVYGERATHYVAQSKLVGASTEQLENQTPLVMVVDDSITVRRVTQRLLQREGYRVLLANDGLMALEKLAEGELPSVILSDIEMPRMDGFDLARNIRAQNRLKDLPIVMITSRIADKHREHALTLGVDHYLGKPYSEDELLGIIQSYTKVEAEAT